MEAINLMNVAGIKINGLMHIGANEGQERFVYQAASIPSVIYVEPISAVFHQLKENICDINGHIAIQGLCSNKSNQNVRFNIASNGGQSSSMMELGYHSSVFPDITYTSHEDLVTITVDELIDGLDNAKKPNILVIDTQGADLKVLQGAEKSLLNLIDAVYVEVSETPLYEGGCTFDEITSFLSNFGFRLRWAFLTPLNYGDAFFCKPAGRRSYEAERELKLSMVEVLSLLTPYDVDKTKARIGPKHDGGYVFIPELFNGKPVFSYGINDEYKFDIEMANNGHKVFMFDHTIPGIDNSSNNPNLIWIKEGVGGSYDASAPIDTIENHIEKYALGDDNLIMKMDVEGYEFPAFETAPDHVLTRFQQIVFEIHNLHALGSDDFRERFVKIISKINKYFTLFHVHANNFDGENNYAYFSGLSVPNLLELSYVRSDLVSRVPSRTLYPTELDFPNVLPNDKKLWFFPFLPTGLGLGDFISASERMEKQSSVFNK